jgi:hypothetical protein
VALKSRNPRKVLADPGASMGGFPLQRTKPYELSHSV